MLLNTDGNVTALLEACFDAPVVVETLVNEVDDRLPTPIELEVEPHRPVLWRQVVLHVGDRPVLRARSVLALDRLDARARAALLAGREPIGSVLRRLDTRRRLLTCTAGDATAADRGRARPRGRRVRVHAHVPDPQRHAPAGHRDRAHPGLDLRPARAVSATAWRALVAGTGLMITGVLPAFLTASLASRIPDDFAFGDSRVGLAIALFHVMCALSATPAGRLVDRIGALAGMRLAAIATAVSCLAIATLAQSALGLTALLIAGGVANAFGGPSVSALLKHEVAVHRQGLAFGAQHSGAPLGALLAGLALPAVAIPFGWRWAFLLVAALALTAIALAPASEASVAPRGVRPRGLTTVHALALAAALASAAGVGMISFLVLYAVECGMSQAAAGLLLVAVSLAATVSRIGVGVFVDRRGQEPLRPVATMLAMSVGGYLLLIAGEPALIVVAALLAGGLRLGVAGWAHARRRTAQPGCAGVGGRRADGRDCSAARSPGRCWSACSPSRSSSRSPGARAPASRCSPPARCRRFGCWPHHVAGFAPVRFVPCSPRSFTTPRTPAEPGPVAVGRLRPTQRPFPLV